MDIEELLVAALEAYDRLRESGEQPDLQAFAAGYPQIQERLLRILKQRRALSQLANEERTQREFLPLPERVGRYRIRGELGRGGMAVVALAEDPELDREVAVKLLDTTHIDVEQRERFAREARILAELSHPHVVPVFDHGREGRWLYIVMERMSGSLQDMVDDESENEPDLEEILRRMAEAAEAVAHCHGLGILHRDIKPSNLLQSAAGSVRVADFGLARRERFASFTRTGTAMGTLGYAAPEQLRGAEVDEGSDIYGLGATLFALFTRRAPPIPAGQPDLSLSLPPNAPKSIARVVARATAARPEDRYAGASDLVEDLRRVLQNRPPKPRLPRLPRLPRVAAFMVLLLLAGSAALLYPRDDELPTGHLIYRGDVRSMTGRPLLRSWVVEVYSKVRYRPSYPPDEKPVFEVAGRSYELGIRPGRKGVSVLLSEDGERIARYLIPAVDESPVEDWRILAVGDVDGDALPEVILEQANERIAVLKWEPRVWPGDPPDFRIRPGGPLSPGIVRLEDIDGDGTPEIVVASLSDGNPGTVSATQDLLVLDSGSGRIEQRYPISGEGIWPPIFRKEGNGRVARIVTLSSAETGGFRLWSIDPSAPTAPAHWDLPVRSGVTGSWPLVRGAGSSTSILFGGRLLEGDKSAVFRILDSPGSQPVRLYTEASADHLNNLLVSRQDHSGHDALCFGVSGVEGGADPRFRCMALVDGDRALRSIWQVSLSYPSYIAHGAVPTGDHNGDGFDELVVGTSAGEILLLSGIDGGSVVARSTLPATLFEAGTQRPPRIHPPPVLMGPASSTQRSVVVHSQDGWVYAYPIPALGDEPLWRLDTEAEITGSPQEIVYRPPEGPERRFVLTVNHDGWVLLVESPEGRGRAEIPWSYRSPAGVLAAPAIHRDGDILRLFFTDAEGYLYRISVDLADLPEDRELSFTARPLP